MEQKVSEYVAAFLAFLREAETRLNMANTEEAYAFSETGDILHDVELVEHEAAEYVDICRKLREVRRRRRAAKDLIAALTPVVQWMDDNRQTVKGLEILLGDVRRAERVTESRIYTPRTDILTREDRMEGDELS